MSDPINRSPVRVCTVRRDGVRRGVVLVFVVAVLVLLAVIATTYLATSRVDRVVNEVRGGPAGGGDDPLPVPTAEVTLDVFDYQATANVAAYDPTIWKYRAADRAVTSTYVNADYVPERVQAADPTLTVTGNVQVASNPAGPDDFAKRQRYDPWLASRSPEPYGDITGGAGRYPAWPKISRWLERWKNDYVFNTAGNVGHFESPWLVSGSAIYTDTTAAVPTYVRINYPTSFITPVTYAGQTAVYPALQFGGSRTYLAADADGDGVADAGLFPLSDCAELSKTDITLPAGTYGIADTVAHPTRWYAAVRIVDNSGNINVNTAWRRDGDIKLDTGLTDAVGSAPNAPNFGFFRSNVGLYELLTLTGDGRRQWKAFTNFRTGRTSDVLTERVGARTDYVYTTFAESMEMNLGRRSLLPGTDGTGAGFQAFTPGLNTSLAFLGGLVNPRETRNALEDTLVYDAYRNVPNWLAEVVTTNGVDAENDKEGRSFTFFAPPDNIAVSPPAVTDTEYFPKLWWHSTYDPDDAARTTYFGGLGFQTSYAGTAGPPPRPVRHLLTAANPQTTSGRMTGAPGVASNAAPLWMRDGTSRPDVTPMVPFPNDARPKVGINTDPFGALWRNFYMTLANPADDTNAVDVALQAAGTNGRKIELPGPSSPGFNPVLLLRSALAAVNAIDQRDGDDDITTYRIDLGPGQNLMVAGAEQQLFISEVKPSTVTPGSFDVTLANPYIRPPDRLLDCRGYSLAFRNPDGAATADRRYQAIIKLTNNGIPQNAPTATAGGAALLPVVTVTPPAGFTAGDLVLLRTRLADGTLSKNRPEAVKNPYDEAAPDGAHLVCVDMVNMGSFAAIIGPYSRPLNNWQIASSGKTYAGSVFVDNPVALDNLPSYGGVQVKHADQPTGNRFPLSGFARNGDMMMIPFVGHYAHYASGLATAALEDSTPITWDVQKLSVVAPAGGPQITGRFTPPRPDLVTAAAAPLAKSYVTEWQSRIFDNFTTLANPMSDALPNMAPESWLKGTATAPDLVRNNEPGLADYVAPVHGLVNINTAPLQVLEMLPWVVNTVGQVDAAQNRTVAQNILQYRRQNGPFRSILDVLLVPGYPAAGVAPSAVTGSFYTSTVVPLSEYALTFNNFNRVSNLITTRSDSLIMYVLVQQWQDYGTATPVLVPGTERRFAYMIDRSQLRDGAASQEVVRTESIPTD